MKSLLQFEDLIRDLDPETFEERAPALIQELDAQGTRLGFDFPRPEEPEVTSYDPLRAQIARVPVMDRQQELHFAMGVELLWMRLQETRRRAGFSPEEVERYPDIDDTKCLNCDSGDQLDCFGCSPETCNATQRAALRDRTYELVAARNEMVERHMHVVYHLLEKYRHVSIPNEDLAQDAFESLFRAVEGFDFRRGFRFKTYAAYWVNQAFLNSIYNQSRTVRVPAYIQKAMKKISAVVEKVDGGIHNLDGIAEASGVDRKLVASALHRNRFTLSLNQVVDREEGSEMMQLIEAEDAAQDPEFGEQPRMERVLARAVGVLNEREKQVLRLRFGLEGEEIRTLAEVGEALGVSLERVRQIQRAALDKMRHGDHGARLEQYA